MRLETPRQFRKSYRKATNVFLILDALEDIVFGDKPVRTEGKGTESLPNKLRDFADLADKAKASTLLPLRDTDHAIDLELGATPPFRRIYPLSQAELAEMHRYIKENLKSSRIRLSTSSGRASILFVPKSDRTLRFCVDYRGLNSVTLKNRHPLPLISEILDRLQSAKYFSKIDIKEAYYRIRIRIGNE